jgi:hypothetical protein
MHYLLRAPSGLGSIYLAGEPCSPGSARSRNITSKTIETLLGEPSVRPLLWGFTESSLVFWSLSNAGCQQCASVVTMHYPLRAPSGLGSIYLAGEPCSPRSVRLRNITNKNIETLLGEPPVRPLL